MKTQNSKLKTQNGFTLLEVVVAMSIVALGVVTLFEIFSLGLRLGARSFERTEATAYGREAIDEFLIRRGASERILRREVSLEDPSESVPGGRPIFLDRLGFKGGYASDAIPGGSARERAGAENPTFGEEKKPVKSQISNFKSQIGFTLIEVTIAITLLALIAMTLYGAFYLGHRAVEKSQARSDESQKIRSREDLLAGYIRSAYP